MNLYFQRTRVKKKRIPIPRTASGMNMDAFDSIDV